MKKYLGTFLVILFSITASRAASLDDLLSKQAIEKIEPVSINGKSVHGIPAAICASLGFSRLVSFEQEPCAEEEVLLGIKAEGTTAAYLYGNARCSHGFSKRLKSVTCAR